MWLAVLPGHRFTRQESVRVEELGEEPFVIPRKGHWQRRLLDQLVAGSLPPRLVCEGDEAAATVALVAADLVITLVPDVARHATTRAEVEFVEIGHSLARRVLALHKVADSEMSAAVRFMRDCLMARAWGSRPDVEFPSGHLG